MNFLLIGPRACGKTTVGKRLAERASMPFVDLDERVLASLGAPSVRNAWISHGEKAWRASELVAIRAALAGDGQIIALGGGTPTITEARISIERERTAGRARVVYLSCTPQVLADRLLRVPGDRPSLTVAGLVNEIDSVLASREATYRALADIVYDTSAVSVPDAAEQLLQRIGQSSWEGRAQNPSTT